MKSRLIIISALKIFFIWVLLPFFSFVPVANAQNEARAFCKEKITGYKADPKTGAFLNPDHNAAARCPGGGNICFQINNCIAEYEFKNQNQSQQKTDVNKTKNTSSNETQNAEQYFKKDIDFTGIMECGPYIGKESTWGNYSTKLSGTLHNGKATITKKWKEGIEDGENILSLVLDKNGKAEIIGKEVISSTIGTYYKNYNFTGGVQNNGNILIASGKKYENGKIIRECKINLAFAKLLSDINSKNLIVIDAQKNKNNAEYKTKDNIDKEAEIERLAVLEIENKRMKEEAEAKAKAAEANRLAAIEAEKQKQREAAEAKAKADKAAKEAEIERLAALEIEKQKQKEAVAARVAAIEAEKQKQRENAEAKERLDREKEIERLAALEIEKKRIREEKEAAIKAEAIRLAAIEAENKRQKEEAEARARAQRVIELENELKKLRTDSSEVKPVVQQRQENNRTDNDPLTAFEGAWASVSPPVFYLIFTKVSLGARQVSLPNIGQANIRLSDGAHGSNFQISAPNLNCYYFVSFTSNRQKMIMELKAGDNLCLQSSILERTE